MLTHWLYGLAVLILTVLATYLATLLPAEHLLSFTPFFQGF